MKIVNAVLRIKNSLSMTTETACKNFIVAVKTVLKLKATLSGLGLNGAHRSFTRMGDASINSSCIKDLALSAV